jgi:hypothetical protein
MLRSLVKIANKLDSLGLTKEADIIDAELIRLAEMEELTIGNESDTSEIVREAIERSKGMPHFEAAFRTRNPSPESEGSTFLEPQTPESLAAASWDSYDHPDVKAPATAYRANIPGYFGILDLSDPKLNPLTPVEIVREHKGTTNKAACIVPASGVKRPESDFTTIILGPSEGGLIVWTFFPGPPIQPSSMIWSEDLANSISTVEAAKNAGFLFGKLGGS